MTPVNLTLPDGAEESNYLYPELEADDLTQDMLTVRLPNGYYVDVGWFPENDPSGRFVIRVFYEYSNVQVANPIETKDISRVVFFVQHLAWKYSHTVIATSRSKATSTIALLPSC